MGDHAAGVSGSLRRWLTYGIVGQRLVPLEAAGRRADYGAKSVVTDLGGTVSVEGADAKVADGVVKVIEQRGGEAVASYDSVSDFEGAERIVKTALDAFGRLDVLVNNAGVLRDRMMFSMTPDDFDTVVKVHMYGTFNTMHHASAYWRNESKEGRQPSASIINTVSSAGLQGQASQINYGAAKAGIAAMTIIAGLELTPDDRVLGAVPGPARKFALLVGRYRRRNSHRALAGRPKPRALCRESASGSARRTARHCWRSASSLPGPSRLQRPARSKVLPGFP